MLEITFSNLRAKNPDYDKDKEREREEEEKERKKAEKKAKKKAKDKEKKKRKKKNKDPDYYGTPQYDAADDPLQDYIKPTKLTHTSGFQRMSRRRSIF